MAQKTRNWLVALLAMGLVAWLAWPLLVPDYLKAIPQDPVAGTNLVYIP